MLLGSGELGREFTIAAKRLGCRIVACDRYANAPAMQMADACEVFPMLDGKKIRAAVEKHRPDVIVPEIEAIDTATLSRARERGLAGRPFGQGGAADFEPRRIRDCRPRARPHHLEIPLCREPRGSRGGGRGVGLPCVVKPVMSSWARARARRRRRGGRHRLGLCGREDARRPPRVIVEEFIKFDSEITILTVATKDGVLFCPPVGHRQEAGDYRESWQPAAVPRWRFLGAAPGAQGGGGAGRPRHFRGRILHSRRAGDLLRAFAAAARHGNGDVDLAIPQPVRAALSRGARPADPSIEFLGPSASAVILGDRESEEFSYEGIAERWRWAPLAKQVDLPDLRQAELRLTSMGIALARDENAAEAVERAKAAASRVRIRYGLKENDGVTALLLAAVACRLRRHSPTQSATRHQDRQRGAAAASPVRRAQSRDGLKRAIYDAGYTCKRITDAGLSAPGRTSTNGLAHCVYDNGASRDWAIFAGRTEALGARLQGCGRLGTAGLQDQAAAEGQLYRSEIIGRPSSGCTGGFPYTRRPPTFP